MIDLAEGSYVISRIQSGVGLETKRVDCRGRYGSAAGRGIPLKWQKQKKDFEDESFGGKMKSKVLWYVSFMIILAAVSPAYLIQGLDLNVEYWAGSGSNECVIAIDWNNTNGPYNSPFHVFGYRWDATQTTVKDALATIDQAGALGIVYGYGGGYISHMLYDQTLVDSDNHTSLNYAGWWWAGQTDDGGLTWSDNEGGIDTEYLWNGGIEAFNIDGTNWGSGSMTIPEPATLALLGAGVFLFKRPK